MANDVSLPPIAITPGDPAGIGPDILLQVAAQGHGLPIVAVADKNMLAKRAKQLGIAIDLTTYIPGETSLETANNTLYVQHIPLTNPSAPYILETLRAAANGCLSGDYRALATGPINKETINKAGIPFSGHTRFLKEMMGVKQTVMMLMTDDLKVALLTAHIPLAEVPKNVTAESLTQCIEIISHDFKDRFNIDNPRIAVCGLNPHAGEGGHLGTEEQTIMIPALNQLRKKGHDVLGPIAADIAFTPKISGKTDVVLAMYHDQGLPALKQHGFGNAVNVTLGLPIIRTSVDHGTAYNIAGTGKANSNSLLAAIKLAAQLSEMCTVKSTVESMA